MGIPRLATIGDTVLMNRSTPTAWVREHNRIAHSSTLRAAGFTEYSIRMAVARGDLHPIRRSWLVTPDCDDRRIAAASVGGRPTCVTAAALAGLWNLDSLEAHVWLPRTASRFDATGMRVHRARGPVPVHARASEEPVVNVLFHVARCCPPEDALAIWESAVRRNVIGLDVLERVQWHSQAASDLAAVVGARSDSGRESAFLVLMRAIGVDVKQQVWVDGHPLDGLIGERLGIQIDGFAHHSSPDQRRRDLKADARLVLRGYTILRFDAWQTEHDGRTVQLMVQHAMAQGLHHAQRRHAWKQAVAREQA